VIIRPHLQATLLTITAGIADAVGYITMGSVFAANMTGNTVLAGIAAAQGDYASAARHIAPLIAFFIGAMMARLLLRLSNGSSIAIMLEAAIIGAVSFLPIGKESAVLVLALAMGLQASAITSFAGTSVSTVVVTSTLARTADAALDRIWPAAEHALPAVPTPHLLVFTWVGYLVGAVIGALLLNVMPWPLVVPAVLLVFVVLLQPHIGGVRPSRP
jgi:uncharacterized membrane protein YoaK (UPF0700 family)